MYSHVRHRSLDETYINQLLNLFSTVFSSNSLKGDALAALRLAYPVASLRKCLPSGQRLFKACSGPSALAQLGFAPLEPPLLPPRARGAGGRAPPAPTHGGWGHSVDVKGPSPRRFASAGRTNPLTLPLRWNLTRSAPSRPIWRFLSGSRADLLPATKTRREPLRLFSSRAGRQGGGGAAFPALSAGRQRAQRGVSK